MQKMKRGIEQGLEKVNMVNQVATQDYRPVFLEIFAGVANLTHVAGNQTQNTWRVLPPVDILFGHDLKDKETKWLWEIIYKEKPDLITLSMPCGSWMNLVPLEEIERKRSEDLFLWRLAREIWDYQTSQRRLALAEQPWASEGLKLTFMEDRPSCWRVSMAQRDFGLKDVENGKPHKKLTAVDVNDPVFGDALAKRGICKHQSEKHQHIVGKVKFKGKCVNRSMLAGMWPMAFCLHILMSAMEVWKPTDEPAYDVCLLSEEAPTNGLWEVGAVSSGNVPEEALRHHMSELGVAADRYGYITFDGGGQQVQRRIRASVAHLHSALGHVSNERLVRMLMLSGAEEEILTVARNLRFQVCVMVHPPQDAPQVSGSKPTNFNEKLSGDMFYTWDSKGVKFAVVHFIDDLTDYQVAGAGQNTIPLWPRRCCKISGILFLVLLMYSTQTVAQSLLVVWRP